jgi:hypothetical protein
VANQNRAFGLIMAGGLGSLALLRYAWTGGVNGWLIGIGLAFFLAALAAPAWLAPVRRGWMKLAAVLGFVNSRILLTVVFIGVVTPIAFLLRLVGRRPFALARDKTAASYWKERRPEEFTPERMERQF